MRMLTNEMYLGHMVQGKTEKINYKLKKSVEKPEKDWVKVENTHEQIISEDVFLVVQNLLKVDGRVSPVSEKSSFCFYYFSLCFFNLLFHRISNVIFSRSSNFTFPPSEYGLFPELDIL